MKEWRNARLPVGAKLGKAGTHLPSSIKIARNTRLHQHLQDHNISLAHALATMSHLPSPQHTSDEAEIPEAVLPSQKTIAFAISVVKSKPPELSIEGTYKSSSSDLVNH